MNTSPGNDIITLLLGLFLTVGTKADNISMDEPEVLLTPYWSPIVFAEGETVYIDCGYFTNGIPENFTITWTDEKGLPVHEEKNRIQINQQYKIKPDNWKEEINAGYSVATLTIQQLEKADGQLYTCNVTDLVTATVKTANIRLEVRGKDKWYGFEGNLLSGWTGDSSEAKWHKHNATDPDILDRSRGPRYDHTYGPSKHTGHFIDVDLEHEKITTTNTTATLVSPVFQPNHKPQCIHFWYILDGNEIDKLTLLVNSSSEQTTLTDISHTEQKGFWTHKMVDLPLQITEYQLIFEAIVCKHKNDCLKGAVALDDIAINDEPCPIITTKMPDHGGLKLRLVEGHSKYEGRVEVLHDGQYGSICSQNFDDSEAQVVCRSLGFDHINATKVFGAAPNNSRIWMTGLTCTGTEHELGQCLLKNHGENTGCTHEQDVGVLCSEPATMEKPVTQPSKPTKIPTVTPIPKTNQSLEDAARNNQVQSTKTPSTTDLSTTQNSSNTKTSTPESLPKTTKKVAGNMKSKAPVATTHASSTSTLTESSTQTMPTNLDTKVSTNNTKDYSKAAKIGRGVVAGIIVMILLGMIIFAVLIYKGRKRRARKSKYLNFGSASYSREHLPTNEFHLESPLTMSSMGYTVLA